MGAQDRIESAARQPGIKPRGGISIPGSFLTTVGGAGLPSQWELKEETAIALGSGFEGFWPDCLAAKKSSIPRSVSRSVRV